MKGLPLRSPFHPKTTLKSLFRSDHCVCSDGMTFLFNDSLNWRQFFFVKNKEWLKLRLKGALYR